LTVNKGELASGLIGEGRMAEPEAIYFYVVENFLRATIFHKKNILITAGGTHEALDPVRFLGNYSTGKMGFAIAEEMYLQGANVTIIAGQVQVATPYKGIKILAVKTADEMYDAVVKEFKHTDIAIMAAAVADYKPKQTAKEKIKKKENELTLQLIKNKDILAYLGSIKKKHQLLIGFALETQQEKLNALNKLKSKNADAIVLNSLKQKGAGFGLNTNKITILNKDGNTKDYSLKSKDAVAKDIVSFIRNIV
jgi:phosphopantothenoylcysteine decarboxylase/phosphopantothenate--cysteine ligase